MTSWKDKTFADRIDYVISEIKKEYHDTSFIDHLGEINAIFLEDTTTNSSDRFLRFGIHPTLNVEDVRQPFV